MTKAQKALKITMDALREIAWNETSQPFDIQMIAARALDKSHEIYTLADWIMETGPEPVEKETIKGEK